MQLTHKDAVTKLGKRESAWWDGNTILQWGPANTIKVYYGWGKKMEALTRGYHWATLHPAGAVTLRQYTPHGGYDFVYAKAQWFPKHFGGRCYSKVDKRSAAQAWIRISGMPEDVPFVGDITMQPDGIHDAQGNTRYVVNLQRRKPILAAWQRWRDFAGTLAAMDDTGATIKPHLSDNTRWGIEPAYDPDVYAEPSVVELAKLSRLRKQRVQHLHNGYIYSAVRRELKSWLERLYVQHGCLDPVEQHKEAA